MVRVDEAEVGKEGGTAEYMEMHHPADLVECNDKNIEELERMWKKIYNEECPYGFDDIHDRDINYQLALERLEEGWKIDVSELKDQIDATFDWRGLTNEATRAFLKRRGDGEFLGKIWEGCTKISLCEPVEGEPGWKIIIESGRGEKRDFLIISQSDFEDSLVVENNRTIKLPGLGDGGRTARVKFIECLHKLRIEGVMMPPVVDVDVRMGVRYPKRKEKA